MSGNSAFDPNPRSGNSAFDPNPRSGNSAFDALVVGCLAAGRYVCLADEALWRDFSKAIDAEPAVVPRARLGWLRRLLRWL